MREGGSGWHRKEDKHQLFTDTRIANKAGDEPPRLAKASTEIAAAGGLADAAAGPAHAEMMKLPQRLLQQNSP